MHNELIEKLSNDFQIMNKFNNNDFEYLIINTYLFGFMESKLVSNLDEFKLIINNDLIKIEYKDIDCVSFNLNVLKIKDCTIEKDDKKYYYQIYLTENASIHLSFCRL